MVKSIIIADDLSGANDTAVKLRKNKYKVLTLIEPKKLIGIEKYDGIAIDTESRNIKKEEAYKKLKKIAEKIKEIKADIIYKKVDSTLRGNISIEIKALFEILKPELIVFTPAYPKMGRCVINGNLLVNGIPLSQTEFSKDSKNPILTSNIEEILKNDFPIRICSIKLNELRKKYFSLKNIKTPIALIFDAENENDLEKIVSLVLRLKRKILWVGSAGLANILFKHFSLKLSVLGIIGSINKITIEQCNFALKKRIAQNIQLKIENLIYKREEEIERVTFSSLKILRKNKNVLITTLNNKREYEKHLKLAKSKGINEKKLSNIIGNALGKIAKNILKSIKISGLFLTGGETAVNILKTINCKSLKLIREIEEGIPLSKICGGKYDGLKIITKAGGFGKVNSIVKIINVLENER